MTFLLEATKLCLTNSELRKLCIKPWLIGLACYVVSFIVACYSYSTFYELLASSSDAWYYYLWNLIMWPVAAVLLLVVCALLAMISTLLLSAVYQGPIARFTLKHKTIELPNENPLGNELARIGKAEIIKLLWIVPLSITIFATGFIPLLAPISLTFGAWILAYQFVDIPLDELHLTASERLKYGKQNFFKLAILGGTLAFVWPFIGLILQPIATTAGSLLVATYRPPASS